MSATLCGIAPPPGTIATRRQAHFALRTLLAACAGVALAAGPALSGDLDEPTHGVPAVTAAPVTNADASVVAPPPGAAGLTIDVDPQTGGLARRPPGPHVHQLSPAEANALSTSHVGLIELPSSVAGGGVVVDLQGRFRSPLFATVGEGGQVTIRHLPGPGIE